MTAVDWTEFDEPTDFANWPPNAPEPTGTPRSLHSRDLSSKFANIQIMDYSDDTNVPVGAVQWNNTDNRFERWSGSEWVGVNITNSINVTGDITVDDITCDSINTIDTDNITLLDSDNTFTGDNTFDNDIEVDGVDVKATLDSLASTVYVYSSTDTYNTASNAFVQITGASISVTVNAGDVVELIAQVNTSMNPEYSGRLVWYRDATRLPGEIRFRAPRGDTNGYDMNNFVISNDDPTAGTYSYSIWWRTDSASYTLYSDRRYLKVRVTKGTEI